MQVKSTLVCPVEVGGSETRGTRYHTRGAVKNSWPGDKLEVWIRKRDPQVPFPIHTTKHLSLSHLCRRSEAYLLFRTTDWGTQSTAEGSQNADRRLAGDWRILQINQMAPDKRTTDINIWELPGETIWSTSDHPTMKLTHSRALHTPSTSDGLWVSHS